MGMTMTSRMQWSAIMIAAAAVATGCASQHAALSRANPVTAGDSNPAPVQCTPATLGYIGVVRPGEAQAAQNALGSALLAQVRDSASGAVDVARSANGITPTAVSAYFSQWKPILSESQQESLKSCDMMLSDRPAAQPIITAAIAAVAQHGYVASAAALQSELQEVLISDNPLAAGSVVVTLLVPGPVVPNPPGSSGGPVATSLDAFTVIMQQSTDEPTGVARGGF
jgi:hypothetical protein